MTGSHRPEPLTGRRWSWTRSGERAMREGIEPSSLGLTGPCSATELPHHEGPATMAATPNKCRPGLPHAIARGRVGGRPIINEQTSEAQISPLAGEKGIEP